MTPSPSTTPVLSLATPAAWRAWLRAHHARSTGVFLRLAKTSAKTSTKPWAKTSTKPSAKTSTKPSAKTSTKPHTPLTYANALEVALAWGWIDGQKRTLGAGAWLQRFTPRTPRSGWSKINRAKAEALIAAGAMEASGLAEVERARQDGRWERAYDGARVATVPPDLAQALARDAKALAFFGKLDGANRYAILYRLQMAKRPETRARRLRTFVEMCARHETLHPPRKSRP